MTGLPHAAGAAVVVAGAADEEANVGEVEDVSGAEDTGTTATAKISESASQRSFSQARKLEYRGSQKKYWEPIATKASDPG